MTTHHIVGEREVEVEVKSKTPVLKMMCEWNWEHECSARMEFPPEIKVCDSRYVEPVKCVTYEVKYECSVKPKRLIFKVEVGGGCEKYYIGASGVKWEGDCDVIALPPHSSATGVLENPLQEETLVFAFCTHNVRDVDAVEVKLSAYAETEYGNTNTASCTMKFRLGYKKPSLSFKTFNVPNEFYVNVPKKFKISIHLETCPVINLIMGILKIEGPGRVYWLKKDGRWHEVTSEWSIDVVEFGLIKPPHDSEEYEGELKFDREGTYRLKFGIGFEKYPLPHEIETALVKTFEEVFGKPVEKVKAGKVTLFTFEKTVKVRKHDVEISKIVA